jgi:hypothetical protein
MDVREVMLLDSQDMDYNVELQKDKHDCDCRKTIATTGAYYNETQPSPYWENVKEVSEGLGFFSFLNKLVSGLLCI